MAPRREEEEWKSVIRGGKITRVTVIDVDVDAQESSSALEQRRPFPTRDGRTEKIDQAWLEIAPPRVERGRVEREQRVKWWCTRERKGSEGWVGTRSRGRALALLL